MKKVFQTIVDKGHGNCMQAAIASLLELELEDVPNFIEYVGKKDNWFNTIHGFLDSKGFDVCFISRSRHETTEALIRIAKFDGGYKGCLYASVPSQTYDDVRHAVIVDLDLNIVHDPNPNQLALRLGPEDVIDILVMHDTRIGATGKLFTKEEWENASEEERDANTFKGNI